jgi:small-conductance mechanosensitive channel
VDKVKSVASELLFTIHDAFRQHDIQIPYPQRDLKLTLDDEHPGSTVRSQNWAISDVDRF